MERISAACAMEWSIQLEKALRSTKPGRSVEAILQIGPKLEQWNTEPAPTTAVYNMFGLVPGEDRLFANTILLRLADAFRLGDIHTRVCVVRVFLSLRRLRNKQTRHNDGILSKRRVDNHLELLTRVKTVFDTGDVESRAMTLILLGCWADFAKDTAEVRYMILSSLVSSHVLEVKASLIAAGCFCELSDDFALVVLEMLVNMVTSSKTLLAVRLAGARAFAKMWCSSSLANRAYKTGLKLVLESSEEDFMVAMLISLSKLATKSMLLISEQVDLLLSFLTPETTLRMRATLLRCLRFIIVGGVCHLPVNAHLIKTLVSMLDEPELPSALQCDALWILHKILLYALPNLPCMDMLEFAKLLIIVENATRSPITLKRLLAIRVLVDISVKIRGRTEMVSGGVCSIPLPSKVVSFVIDQITLLVKPVLDPRRTDSEVELEGHGLLNLLLLVVEEHPDLGVLALDKIYFFIEYLVNTHGTVTGTRQPGLLGHETLEFIGENSRSTILKLVFYVYRFVVGCLENLNEAGAITTQILHKVTLLVEQVHRCSFFDCPTHTIYSLILHSRITWDCLMNENKEIYSFDKNLGMSLHDYLVEYEILTLECAKKLLAGRDNWSAYRSGKYAACQGAWFTATFIFEQLITKVQSESCCCWLKSLAQFAHAESKIQLLLSTKESSRLVNWLEINKISISTFKDDSGEIGQDVAWNINSPKYCEKLVEVYNSLCSSEETLGAIVTSGQAFCFQRWFLVLRAKVLETVVDILKFLGTVPFNQDEICDNRQVERSIVVELPKLSQQTNSLGHFLTKKSLRLKRLAQEFDLIATSFIGMDSKSSKIISALALSCSLLAFCTGFVLLIPNLPAYENFTTSGLENSENCSHTMLIQNLVGRLWHIDHETSTNLRSLLTVSGQPKNCFHLQSKNKLLNIGCEARDILTFCSYAVTRIVGLQNEVNGVLNEEILSQVAKDGLRLLFDILKKWMNIPFRTPKYFFQVRPCIGSELFASNTDTRYADGISVLPGFHLSLNLCLQLKNVPPDLPVRLTKLYCILYCGTSFQIPRPSEKNKGPMQLGFRAWETENMVDLNEKLLRYVMDCTEKVNSKFGRDSDGDGGVVNACVCFEPNQRGQGFSTCLLDVSAFPVGSYRIKWHCCCVDNQGSYWSLLPLNTGPVFTVQKSHNVR